VAMAQPLPWKRESRKDPIEKEARAGKLKQRLFRANTSEGQTRKKPEKRELKWGAGGVSDKQASSKTIIKKENGITCPILRRRKPRKKIRCQVDRGGEKKQIPKNGNPLGGGRLRFLCKYKGEKRGAKLVSRRQKSNEAAQIRKRTQLVQQPKPAQKG